MHWYDDMLKILKFILEFNFAQAKCGRRVCDLQVIIPRCKNIQLENLQQVTKGVNIVIKMALPPPRPEAQSLSSKAYSRLSAESKN